MRSPSGHFGWHSKSKSRASHTPVGAHWRALRLTPTCVDFMVTVAVVGIPRHVVVQRVMLVELASVDGAVWRR